MIYQDANIKFQYTDGEDTIEKIILVRLFEISVKPLGKLKEYLDFTLVEDYTWRMQFNLDMLLDLGQSNYIADWIQSTTKKIIVDEKEYNVVIPQNGLQYKLHKKSNARAEVNLKLERTESGIDILNQDLLITEDAGSYITTEDEEIIILD